MKWIDQTPSDRLSTWREYRETLNDLNIEDAIETVLYFFNSVPYGSPVIDICTPASWPTPWELVESPVHCPSSISLMMFHTLSMSFPETEITLHIASMSNVPKLIVEVNGLLLNYNWCAASPLSEITPEFTFEKTQIKQYN